MSAQASLTKLASQKGWCALGVIRPSDTTVYPNGCEGRDGGVDGALSWVVVDLQAEGLVELLSLGVGGAGEG